MDPQEEHIRITYGERAYSICSIISSWNWKTLKFERTLYLFPEKEELDLANEIAELIKRETRTYSKLEVKVIKP